MHFNFSIIPFYVYWGVFILLFLFQKKWFERFLHCLCYWINFFFGIADVQWQHGEALFRTVASQQDGRRFQSVAKLKKLFIKLYKSRDGALEISILISQNIEKTVKHFLIRSYFWVDLQFKSKASNCDFYLLALRDSCDVNNKGNCRLW